MQTPTHAHKHARAHAYTYTHTHTHTTALTDAHACTHRFVPSGTQCRNCGSPFIRHLLPLLPVCMSRDTVHTLRHTRTTDCCARPAVYLKGGKGYRARETRARALQRVYYERASCVCLPYQHVFVGACVHVCACAVRVLCAAVHAPCARACVRACAAVNGAAPAAGALLAMSCDYRVMAQDYVIGLNETRFGLGFKV